MAAVEYIHGICVVCGGPIPPRRRAEHTRVTCGPVCERARRHDSARARVCSRRALGITGQRPGLSGVEALEFLVARDRAEHGELSHVVDWPAGTCPRARGDTGPCIHVGCRSHACSDVTATGALWIDPAFERDPYSVQYTCMIDRYAAEPGDQTLEQVAGHFHLTRERIRQIEAKALGRAARDARTAGLQLEDLLPEPHAPSGLASLQGGDHKTQSEIESGRRVPVRGLRLGDIESPPCRPPSAPAPEPRPRAVLPLPPSLEAHRAELGARRRRRGDPPAWPAVAEWRRGEGDIDEIEAFDKPALRPDKTQGPVESENEACNDCNGAECPEEEPMSDVMTKVTRLLEVREQLAALAAEREQLERDPDIIRLRELIAVPKRGRPRAPKGEAKQATPSPAPEKPPRPHRAAARKEQIAELITDEPRNYRAIAKAAGIGEAHAHGHLDELVREGRAVKMSPGMYRKAA